MQKITLINLEIETYSENFASWPNHVAREIVRDTDESLQYADMLSGNQVTGLLRMLIASSGAKVIAEIGMFTGLATLAMADILPENGVIYALEMNSRYADIARKHFAKSKVEHKIELLFGDARVNVHQLPENLDLVFLDADKDYYPNYYDILLPKIRKGGLMVIDNVHWYGGVLNSEKDRKSASIHTLNERIQVDDSVENVMLTVRDGLMIVRKK
jgi:caffeoyl-CoA O-methyltransferase